MQKNSKKNQPVRNKLKITIKKGGGKIHDKIFMRKNSFINSGKIWLIFF